MNTPLLRKIQKAILAEPIKLDMSLIDCGAVACICGWALRLATQEDKKQIRPGYYNLRLEQARMVLGLKETEEIPLFFVDSWPAEFKIKFNEVPFNTDKEEGKILRAKITSERIEHFINTGE